MLLEAAKLEVAYGGIRAVKGIDIAVDSGELVALIGANGAGKTTTLKALAGMLPWTAGHGSFDGKPLREMPLHQRVRQGLVLVPEGRGVFARLSIAENLDMGAYARRDGDIAADMERMYALFPRLKDRRTQLAGTLSGGEQQMLAMARALMARPRLLMLDEPSMGLAPMVVELIFKTIRDVSAQGVTILLVEQNARLALTISQRAYVMESGLVTLSGKASDLLDNPKVRAAYLGE
ncbi:MAG: transporter related protein [Betaproteobacteria bacterium]|nr:transporter related protein [Betaproteobacteria bacterium]